jgi:hypothetical protein
MPICPAASRVPLAYLSPGALLPETQCPCAPSWKQQQVIPRHFQHAHAALHQRQCAPFPSQYSHLREKKELIMLMQDPQSTQHRLSARDTPARTVDQLSTCQKRRRVEYNLLYFYRRYGPTDAAASQGCRPGLALELTSACRPSAVSFVATLAYPTTRRLGKKDDFQPMEPKDHLHESKP